MSDRGLRRDFTDEFKEKMVQLYLSGKIKADIIREYDLSPSCLNRWIKQHQGSGYLKKKIIVPMKKMNLFNCVKKING